MQTPLHPKRHIVMKRNWSLEPQEHQLEHNAYAKQTYRVMNPWIMQQLQTTEKFNRTPSEA